MADLKELLAEATPGPWRYGAITMDDDGLAGPHHEIVLLTKHPDAYPSTADVNLIVHLRNHAEDYEAAVEALDELAEAGASVNYDDTEPDPGFGDWRRFDGALTDARTALARLRGTA